MPGSIAYAAGVIRISQPDKRNAISAAMWRDLGLAADAAAADGPTAVIVTGDGGHFAAGADISEFADVYATRTSAEAYTRVMLASLDALAGLAAPTIAVIRGACVGGGCSLALACDFRFAAASARFAVTPGKLGLVYSLADTRRLARAAGVRGARDLLMTARMIEAEEARALGLVDRLYPDDALDAAAAAFVEQVAALSPFSIGATKEMLRLLEAGFADEDEAALALMLDAFDGTDFKEGYRAFLDKRPPKFR